MKKKLLVLWITLATVVVGLFGALILMVNASSSTAPNIEIAYCNLSFRDSICIKYAIPSSDADVKVLIWTSPRSEYLIGTQDDEITAYNTQNISGVPHKVFDYNKLAAKQMADVVYARAYAQVDGEEYYSSVNKYSVLQYAYNKLGKTATASTDAELKDLLTQMLEYGAAAQKYLTDYKVDRLATADWYQIKVTAGVLDDGCTHGLYLPGDQVTITAPEMNAEGGIFSCWTDELGNTVSIDSSYELIVGNANKTYTPVYKKYSVGLKYTSNGDGTCYVAGIGTCTDTDIIIPTKSPDGDTVTSVGVSAFFNCSNLTSIEIPEGVMSIGEGAFYYCTSLTSITVDSNNSAYQSIEGNLYSKDGKTLVQYAVGKTDTYFVIPDGVTNIGENAFENCYNLTSIEIPEGVTSIGYDAFRGCTSLTSIEIPDSVTSIGYDAFRYCSLLTSIEIPDGVTSIGDRAFYECDGLTSVVIPDGVTSIGDAAFYDCESLTSIEIPDSVTSIGGYVFSSCSSLTSVTFAEGSRCTSIGNWAFQYCTSLTSIEIPDSVTNIGYEAFYNTACYNNTSNWKQGALYIGNHLIATNSALSSSYTIRNGTKTIALRAFSGHSNLTSVTIPDSVTSIGEYAFYDCSNLTSIEIPDSVTSISAWAFKDCTSLTSIKYRGTEEQWEAIVKGSGWDSNTGDYTITYNYTEE